MCFLFYILQKMKFFHKIKIKFTTEGPSFVIIKCYFIKFKSSILRKKKTPFQTILQLSFVCLNYLTFRVLLILTMSAGRFHIKKIR
jgi:hypothetical protein